ncbi:MAG: dynamin family protein, partial [Burkholderiales bacterium]
MHRAPLDTLLQQFFNWRVQLSRELQTLHDWLRTEKLDNVSLAEKIPRLLHKLEQEKITIAVVAEFSRGKTELINALFFADLGQRLLPSGAGTTTMCPTEILYDPSIAPGLRLLPIQTRESHENLYEFKNNWDSWSAIDFDMKNPDSVSEACQALAETILVNVETAERYGLYDSSSGDTALIEGGMIEIPRWRHAVFNYPHPLLKQGLVIVDTPGLNAIGTEHELTLSTIPNAHAILFILGADTGVTKSDRAMWQDHIASAGIARGNCVVALNKIDTMWDDLRPAKHYASDVEQQVKKSAQLLGISTERIFPVSAQKGLIARIQKNAALLERSRLLPLEKALAQELPQAHHTVMQLAFKAEVEDLLRRIELDLQSRQDDFNQRLREVSSLQGQNRATLMTSAEDAASAMESFRRVAERFEKLNVIITRQGHGLLNTLDPELWQLQINATRKKMQSSI